MEIRLYMKIITHSLDYVSSHFGSIHYFWQKAESPFDTRVSLLWIATCCSILVLFRVSTCLRQNPVTPPMTPPKEKIHREKEVVCYLTTTPYMLACQTSFSSCIVPVAQNMFYLDLWRFPLDVVICLIWGCPVTFFVRTYMCIICKCALESLLAWDWCILRGFVLLYSNLVHTGRPFFFSSSICLQSLEGSSSFRTAAQQLPYLDDKRVFFVFLTFAVDINACALC